MIVDLEFVSVVARKVRTRELTPHDARDALRDFNADKQLARAAKKLGVRARLVS